MIGGCVMCETSLRFLPTLPYLSFLISLLLFYFNSRQQYGQEKCSMLLLDMAYGCGCYCPATRYPQASEP